MIVAGMACQAGISTAAFGAIRARLAQSFEAGACLLGLLKRMLREQR